MKMTSDVMGHTDWGIRTREEHPDTTAWREFFEELFLHNFPGLNVRIAFLQGGTKFPKRAYPFAKNSWEWDLPGLCHKMLHPSATLQSKSTDHEMVFIYRKGKACRYYMGINDTKGTRFYIDRNKHPISNLSQPLIAPQT